MMLFQSVTTRRSVRCATSPVIVEKARRATNAAASVTKAAIKAGATRTVKNVSHSWFKI